MKIRFTINYNTHWGQALYICGSQPSLGYWDETRALPLQCISPSQWSVDIEIPDDASRIDYHFLVKENNTVVRRECGKPHMLWIDQNKDQNKDLYVYDAWQDETMIWRAAGVAIPVFSLRTRDSWGIGEFSDLKKMVDWAVQTNQKVIQILPVNDTTGTHTWRDSYPYNAISIYALHPLYLSVKDYPLQNTNALDIFRKDAARLNDLPKVDYEQVSCCKWVYFAALYREIGEETLSSSEYISFYEQNEEWLFPYACFCALRDKYRTAKINQWGKYGEYNRTLLEALIAAESAVRESVRLNYFLQYLLHKQLTEVKEYAQENNIILKGDIPIGINRDSVEAWVEPHLFNLDTQTGAPPDDFSVNGQNWGFPTYNWDEMAKDGYRWWIKRFRKMADYFGAYRIDHILGFFRIWEIPTSSVQGMLGYFSPAMPLSTDEIEGRGFQLDEQRMTTAHIHKQFLPILLGEYAQEATDKYLHRVDESYLALNDECNTQRKVEQIFMGATDEKSQFVRAALYEMCNEVLFVRDKREPMKLHPRISAQHSLAYKGLSEEQKEAFNHLYNDFFYHRHSSFWQAEAMKKLPTLISSTSMLVCGEDLGMIPSCVPAVMNRLQILSLEIERMPKDIGVLFGTLPQVPYMSVCTTSTHDMNPIRAWWHEDRQVAQQYYNQVLWKEGTAPDECTSDLCWQVLTNHLNSPAMLCILPLQDWLSFYDDLKNPDAVGERINVPSDPNHYWRYRMHLTLEDLIGAEHYNGEVKKMVNNGRR